MARLYFNCLKPSDSVEFNRSLYQAIMAMTLSEPSQDVKLKRKKVATNYRRKDILGTEGKTYVLQYYKVNGIGYAGLHLSSERSKIKSYGSRGIDCRHIMTVNEDGTKSDKSNYTLERIEWILGDVLEQVRGCKDDDVLVALVVS